MSRRTLHTDDYKIVAGWDRPLQQYFFQVIGEDYEIELDSLEDDSLTDINNIAAALDKYAPGAPPEFLDALIVDGATNAGNVFADYEMDGVASEG
jgi:hypothetical protein